MEDKGEGEQIVFNSIHDSFWVHPCNVAELNKHIRDGFVDIYNNVDIVDHFVEHMEEHVVPNRFWAAGNIKFQGRALISYNKFKNICLS